MRGTFELASRGINITDWIVRKHYGLVYFIEAIVAQERVLPVCLHVRRKTSGGKVPVFNSHRRHGDSKWLSCEFRNGSAELTERLSGYVFSNQWFAYFIFSDLEVAYVK